MGASACSLHLNPREMENGLQFLKLILRSDSLKMQLFFSPAADGLAVERRCSFLGQTLSAIEKRQEKKHELTFIKRELFKVIKYCACDMLKGSCGPVPTDPLLCFHCRGELWCYFPFHTSVRGQTHPSPPPPQRGLCSEEEFHVWEWDDYRGPGRGRASSRSGERFGIGVRGTGVQA